MGKIMKLKGTVSSLELVEQINLFRKQEYYYKLDNSIELGKVEEKKGSYVELKHKTLLSIIRDEFEDEINEQKILPVKYEDSKGEKRPMYILSLDQARQVLIRESKYVRKKIFEYIKKLEQEIINLKIALANRNNTEWLMTRQQGKLIRRNETDVISSLIVYARNQGSKNYNKLYTVYSKLVNNLVGINSNMRDIVDMKTLEHIRLLEDLFSKLIVNSMEQEIYYKEIYQICKRKGTELMNLLEIECKQLDNKEVDLIEYTEK